MPSGGILIRIKKQKQIPLGIYIDRCYRLKQRVAQRKAERKAKLFKTVLVYQDTEEYWERYFQQVKLLMEIHYGVRDFDTDLDDYSSKEKYELLVKEINKRKIENRRGM